MPLHDITYPYIRGIRDLWDPIPVLTWQNVPRVKVNCEI